MNPAKHDSTFTEKPLEWKDLFAAMDDAPTTWIPTTEKMYWAMLECAPPRALASGKFLLGEAHQYNSDGEPVYACFKVNKTSPETYEARWMTLREFIGIKLTVEQFRSYIQQKEAS